ncbi:hypothetical protein MVEN_02322600 [Mycena venus]|uniref:Uncharacterized protein n=1 Tax=Mycena venus TaxID=2733690 RepID=A0A8H7CED8_9AGAR|nr:hypothetical protein MVEN_02322600 [Mycena venus]
MPLLAPPNLSLASSPHSAFILHWRLSSRAPKPLISLAHVPPSPPAYSRFPPRYLLHGAPLPANTFLRCLSSDAAARRPITLAFRASQISSSRIPLAQLRDSPTESSPEDLTRNLLGSLTPTFLHDTLATPLWIYAPRSNVWHGRGRRSLPIAGLVQRARGSTLGHFRLALASFYLTGLYSRIVV